MIRVFRHYVPVSLLMLALVEALIFFISIYLGKSIRVLSYDMTQPGLEDIVATAVVFMVTLLVIMAALGLYERNFWDGKGDMLLRVGVSFLLGLFVMTLIYYFFPSLYLGRGEFGLAFSVAFGGVLLARYVFFHISDRNILKRRVLVLGAGKKAAGLENLMRQSDSLGFSVVGFIPLGYEAKIFDAVRLLRVETTLFDLAEKLRIDEIVIAMDDRRKGFPVEEILECKISGVDVTDLLTFFERETGKIQLEALHPSSMIFSDGFHQAVLKTTSKRLFDILASLLLLALTWPLMLATAVAIWFEGWGRDPILYRQERVGKNGRVFQVLKFRSMKTDAEREGPQWAKQNDSRVTRIGAFIRKSRIDELPQLLNVLRGQMSFVGPRPERPEFVAHLSRKIPYYSMRHRVNPGITGWAQICYPYGASDEDAREKLQYDLYYIKNYSLFLDLMVLIQTAHVILWGKGAR